MSDWVWCRRAGDLGQDEQGQGLVEYGFILLLVVIACVGAVIPVGEQIAALLSRPVASFFG